MTENEEFVDTENRRFFMRSELEGEIEISNVEEELKRVLPGDSLIKLFTKHKKKIIILASKEHHCLADLLVRHTFNELNAEILAVISNHKDLEELTNKFGVPFHYIPTTSVARQDHELKLIELLKKFEPEYLILAKYMRVLSAEFVTKYEDKIINIHHSFLPAFVGAKPYAQAFGRGVKMIGATAHFVTQDLDEGPIIAQDVIQVNHGMNSKSMAMAGREVEKRVLAEALNFVFDERVFVYRSKTVVFN